MNIYEQMRRVVWAMPSWDSAAQAARRAADNAEVAEPTRPAAEHTFAQHDLDVALRDLVSEPPQ